jgi:hypothetical protein
MKQESLDTLAISFSCPTDIEVGDMVAITGDKTVGKPTSEGTLNYVGVVQAHQDGASVCTVQTRFLRRNDIRISGGAVPVGPVVLGTDGKLIAFDAQTHSPAAIVGMAITAATAADQTIETLEY